MWHGQLMPLDVTVVRKLGVPFQPELGMGAGRSGRTRWAEGPLRTAETAAASDYALDVADLIVDDVYRHGAAGHSGQRGELLFHAHRETRRISDDQLRSRPRTARFLQILMRIGAPACAPLAGQDRWALPVFAFKESETPAAAGHLTWCGRWTSGAEVPPECDMRPCHWPGPAPESGSR